MRQQLLFQLEQYRNKHVHELRHHVLQLVADSWKRVGVKLFSRPSQLEVFRNRIYAGDAVMVISKGIDNGIPTPAMAPGELVPIEQTQYQWPKWGQWFQTRGGAGEEADLKPEVIDLRF